MKHSTTELLLDRICIELGFCLSPIEKARLIKSSPTSVQEFTDAIFIAVGLNPQYADIRLWRQVRDRVAEHFNAPVDL